MNATYKEDFMMTSMTLLKLIKHTLLILLLLAALPVSANVGKVVYGYGNNHAFDSDGNRRELRKGSQIQEGDTLVTGYGRMHVRLIDGGFISIYPNSEYKIEEFKFSGSKVGDKKGVKQKPEGKGDRGFFSLLKGAARQVTGLLGRTYNKNFKFKTVVATIGIRGTGFFARLCQGDCFDADGNPLQDGLHVKNNTGIITVETNVGVVSLAQGQSAFAASSEDQPIQTVQPPIPYNLVTPDIELFDFDEKVAGVNLDEGFSADDTTGDTSNDATPIVITNMEYVTSIDTFSGAPLGGINTTGGADTVQQSGNEISGFTTDSGVYQAGGALVFDKSTATLAESGSDTSLRVVWNRWTTGYTLSESAFDVTQQGTGANVAGKDIHLIGTDNLTSTIPGAGRGVVTYASTGGTSPTIEGFAGSQVGTQTVTADIDYRSAVITNFQLDLNFSNATISVSSPGAVSLTSVSGNIVTLDGGCTGSGCAPSVPANFTGSASVNLVGENAEGIYGVYNINNFDNAVSGSYVATEDTGGGD